MEGSVRVGGGKGVCNGLMVMCAMSLLPQLAICDFLLTSFYDPNPVSGPTLIAPDFLRTRSVYSKISFEIHFYLKNKPTVSGVICTRPLVPQGPLGPNAGSRDAPRM